MKRSGLVTFCAVLVLSSLLFVEQSLSATTPVAPEFKLSWTTRVYDEPAATSQWSGEQIYPGSHTEVREVTIKVKNQPHEGYINDDPNGAKEKMYYNVRVKNHASTEWIELWGKTTFWKNLTEGTTFEGVTYHGASDSEVTYIMISFNGPKNSLHSSKNVDLGQEVDFQVKALIGYLNFYTSTFMGQESDWSNTQTLIIDPSAQVSSSPAPGDFETALDPTQPVTPSNTLDNSKEEPGVPLSIFVTVTAAFLVAIVLLLVFYRRPMSQV